MTDIVLATDDGVWRIPPGPAGAPEPLGLARVRVTHVAQRGDCVLASVPGDGVYAWAPDRSGERIFEGDARSCGIGPDGSLYVGIEPAMLLRRAPADTGWRRCDAIDALPTRASWSFPPPPHQPHVLAIDFLPGEPASVLAGIEVGGVILSRDGGVSWCELNDGVYADVHQVRPAPAQPGLLYAVTGRGFYASEDGGASWERRMAGLDRGYTMGLSVHPERPGEVLVASGDRPPGHNARVYHSEDGGRSFVELRGAPLPVESRRAAVPFHHAGRAWLATDTGALLCAAAPRKTWSLACELPARINAAAGDASPSSVMH